MTTVIETQGITKQYGKVIAVDGVDLSINKGEIYGFLGLNGAGKTTTIRMLLGMIKATAGKAILNGQDVQRAALSLWNDVGFLVEIPYAYPELTVIENLEMFRRLRFVEDVHSVKRMIDLLKLTPFKDRQARHLSSGNSQRLGLAKALLHQPKILILDEPANGLDPAGIVETRLLLKDLAKNQGVTIFISSHILSEVAKFSDRIGIIHQAKLLQEMDTHDLETILNRHLYIEVKDSERALQLLRQKDREPIVAEEGLICLSDQASIAHPEQINEWLVQAGCVPMQLKIQEEDLESYFLRLITSTGGDQ